jgi:hypothetical protein
VSVNAFYSENAFGFFRSQRDFQQTNSTPAYLRDYRTTDNYNNRVQRSLSTKWDYRLSRNSLLKVNLIYNDAPEPMRRQYLHRAYTGSQTTVPSATTGIVPGFTDRVTTVRAIPTASNATFNTTAPALIDMQSTLINREQRLRNIDVAGEHKLDRLELDWAGLWSRTRYRYLGAEGVLTNRIGNIPYVGPNGLAGSPTNNVVGPNGETGVGWILDRTQNDLYPRFIYNGGLDWTNPAYYRPAVNGLSTQAGNLDIDLIREVRGNAKYLLPISAFTMSLKTGFSVRDHTVELERRNRRWSYLGKNSLNTDPLDPALGQGQDRPQHAGVGSRRVHPERPTHHALAVGRRPLLLREQPPQRVQQDQRTHHRQLPDDAGPHRHDRLPRRHAPRGHGNRGLGPCPPARAHHHRASRPPTRSARPISTTRRACT